MHSTRTPMHCAVCSVYSVYLNDFGDGRVCVVTHDVAVALDAATRAVADPRHLRTKQNLR